MQVLVLAQIWLPVNVSLQGNTEQHQLTLIAQLCGAINEEVCPNVFLLHIPSEFTKHM